MLCACRLRVAIRPYWAGHQAELRARSSSVFSRDPRCKAWSSAAKATLKQEACAAAVDMGEWPCKVSDLESARQFVRQVASTEGKVLLAPDRDADGLCAGIVEHDGLLVHAPC